MSASFKSLPTDRQGAGIAQWSSTGLSGLSGVWVLVQTRNFSPHHCVQIGPRAHPASCPMGAGGPFLGGKVVRAWSWLFTPIKCWSHCVELYLHSPMCLHGVVLR